MFDIPTDFLLTSFNKEPRSSTRVYILQHNLELTSPAINHDKRNLIPIGNCFLVLFSWPTMIISDKYEQWSCRPITQFMCARLGLILPIVVHVATLLLITWCINFLRFSKAGLSWHPCNPSHAGWSGFTPPYDRELTEDARSGWCVSCVPWKNNLSCWDHLTALISSIFHVFL
jgi:hypothetical protein